MAATTLRDDARAPSGTGVVADANDVSSSNIPVGGGSCVDDATRVAGSATGTPGGEQGGSDQRNDRAHGGQPVPSFWNFAESEQNSFADRGHHHFEMMWHYA